MARYWYFAEDLETRERRGDFATKSQAKEVAKARSLRTGHPVAVVAVVTATYEHHPQGAYYGRTWREGAHHYVQRGSGDARRRRRPPVTVSRGRLSFQEQP